MINRATAVTTFAKVPRGSSKSCTVVAEQEDSSFESSSLLSFTTLFDAALLDVVLDADQKIACSRADDGPSIP